jgi:hypothetical protein
MVLVLAFACEDQLHQQLAAFASSPELYSTILNWLQQ